MFKTPEEAIAASDKACEAAWIEYSKALQLDPNLTAEAYALAKRIFRQGYITGAHFVSSAVVRSMGAKAVDASTLSDPAQS